MKKNIHLFLLFVLVGFGFSSYANKFLVESFKNDPSDLAAQRFERKDDSDMPCAIIKVMTDIEGLSFESNIAIVGSVVIKPGEYWVYVSPGEKRLRILKKGFEPLDINCSDFNIRIESSSVYVLKVRSEIPEAPLVDLAPKKGTVNLTSIPSGARIIIEGEPEFSKLTPYLFEQRSPGPLKVTLKKDNYEPKDTVVQVVPDSVINITVPLFSKFGFLYFSVNPPLPTSTITIDGKVIHTIKEKEAYPISKGMHTIAFDSQNWFSEERKVNVVLGETDSLIVNLKPITGKLIVNVSPSSVDKAEVWINDKNTGKFAPDEFPLQVGDYTVTLKKEGYPEKSKPFSLSKGENLNLKFSMQSIKELQKEVRSHRVKQNIWMTTAVAFGAAGGYLMMEANNKYTEYQTATGATASSLHTTIDSYQQIAPVALGVAVFSAIEFTIQISKKGKAKHWLNIGTDGQKASLTAKF
jgi:hypothetical protein